MELCRVAQRGPHERSRVRATAPSRWSSTFSGAGTVRIDRRRTRDVALKVLFQHDVGHVPIGEALQVVSRGDASIDWAFVDEVCRGVAARRAELDALIRPHLTGWALDRLASVDRVILRMALYELRHLATPPGVVINEAVELAKRYGTEDSGRFVNGVLGTIYREEQRASGSQPAPQS